MDHLRDVLIAQRDKLFATSSAASKAFNVHTACDRVKVNGNQCVWWGSQCIPNVQCSMKEGKCSDDCNLCGGFGCVPRGQQCPTGCEQFTAKDRCNRYVASNGINCFWNPSHNICVYAKSSTVLGELQHEPSAIGGTASPEPPPLDILLAIRRNLLAKRPSLLPDGERILPAQMETLEQAAASNSDNGGDAGRPTSNSIATTGNDRLGAEQSGDNAQSNSNASNGNRSSGTRTSKDNTPTAVSATQPASATSTSDGNDPNNNNNGAMDASLQQSTISGSIKLWVALCGVAVALVAVAGIAFLVVQQRMRARRELLAEQRNAEMHNIHPEHRRESLLPYVQNALRADDMVQTPPTAATANSNNYH
ncbi:hypothetical protein BDF22DRAFT_653274 [Syncephalis plumigaleata]|nr:hypothetical protein BDF22DRAFT_653274 [Syncephalis plumigaleata]